MKYGLLTLAAAMMVTSCGSGQEQQKCRNCHRYRDPRHSRLSHVLTRWQKAVTIISVIMMTRPYGHTWKYVDGASDVKGVTGQYPGLMSWDLGLIEVDSANNLDGVPFSFIASEIAKQHARGGVNAISWHALNPMSGGGSWDVSATPLHNLGEGSAVSDTMKVWIDRAAAFIASLKDSEGNPIPVIFRPWHENSGSWFWWGKDHSTPEEYIELWKMTRAGFDARGIDNVVWAYSPDKDLTREEYFSTYPGDEYVDILGTDIYHFDGEAGVDTYVNRIKAQMPFVVEEAQKRGKIAAFTETGLEGLPVTDWYTRVLAPAIKGRRLPTSVCGVTPSRARNPVIFMCLIRDMPPRATSRNSTTSQERFSLIDLFII